MKVRIKRAVDGTTFWSVTANNNRKVATAGERFVTPANSRRAFSTLARGIRTLTDDEFETFMEGLREKVSE